VLWVLFAGQGVFNAKRVRPVTAVRFERDGDRYVISFAYDPMLIEHLKKTVPAYARSWRQSEKLWIVDSPFAEQLARDIAAHGHTVIGMTSDRPRHKPDDADNADWARALLHRVGPTRAGPVFRSLSKILHPDNNMTGDAQLQLELNAAHGELLSDRKASA
jgi:hypothetical protein